MALQGADERTGNRVYIDDKLVIDNWKIMRAFQPHATLRLTPGTHKVVVEEDSLRSPVDVGVHFGIVAQSKVVDPKVKELAAKADVVIVAAGFDANSESEGADRTFDLPFGQDELIREVAAVNKKAIVAITSGGNVNSTRWLDQVSGLIETWYAGQEGGTALAEVIFGAVNPSGHLPATFERNAEDNPAAASYYPEADGITVSYKEGIFVGYRGYDHNHTRPLFPFGYGLSYTTFKFANLSVTLGTAAHAVVSFDVTNTGNRAGAEVAQIYVSDSHAKVPRPEKELKGFEKVSLQPGETKHVSVSLDSHAFAYYDTQAKKWTIAPGKFNIAGGDSSDSLDLKDSVEISQQAATSAF